MCIQNTIAVTRPTKAVPVLHIAWASQCFTVILHVSKVAHQAGTYLHFLQHEATRSISSPPCEERWSIIELFPALNLPVPIYTLGWRGTVKATRLAREHSSLSPVTTRTRAAQSRDGRTNDEATAPCFNIVSIKWIDEEYCWWAEIEYIPCIVY